MKHALKVFCLGAAITVFIGACSGNKPGSAADSATVDSSTSTRSSTDTLIKTDTAKLVADTPKVKVDTMSKTVTKKTVVKKTVVKKP